MKLTLKLTFVALIITGVYGGTSQELKSETLSSKERIRFALKEMIKNRFEPDNIESTCPRPLAFEDILFAEKKIHDFIACGNATIDIFVDKLDNEVGLDDLSDIRLSIRRYTQPVYEVFDDIFRCIGALEPVIDMCIEEDEKIFKNKIFAIVPLIHQTVCLRNGALFADIVGHNDGPTCMERTFNSMLGIGFLELFKSDSDELFGDQQVCQRFSEVLERIYVEVGECSFSVLGMVKEMLGFFCDGTQCERYIHDLQCY